MQLEFDCGHVSGYKKMMWGIGMVNVGVRNDGGDGV